MGADFIQASSLAALSGIRHAFFTRKGGVSPGIYGSLNAGLGSNDAPENVRENRARMAAALGVADGHLVSCFQIHSPDVIVAERPWTRETAPRADAIVTRTPGIAVGVGAADCGPVLLADGEAQVIGAAHAGWKGAIGGVLEATVAAMEALGARRERIAAALGPMIRQASYEVGPEFVAQFTAGDPDNARFFVPSPRAATRSSTCPASSPRGSPAPASGGSRTCGCAPMPIPSASSATAAPRIGASRTTGATSTPSPSCPERECPRGPRRAGRHRLS